MGLLQPGLPGGAFGKNLEHLLQGLFLLRVRLGEQRAQRSRLRRPVTAGAMIAADGGAVQPDEVFLRRDYCL